MRKVRAVRKISLPTYRGENFMFEYRIFEEELTSVDIGKYTSYGIKVFEISDTGERCIVSLSDVSTEKAFVEAFAHLCNKEKLSPLHLFDVAEDLLP